MHKIVDLYVIVPYKRGEVYPIRFSADREKAVEIFHEVHDSGKYDIVIACRGTAPENNLISPYVSYDTSRLIET